MLLAQVGFDSAVDLGDLDALVLEGGGGLLVVRGEGLAVSTPRGEELQWNNRHVVSRLRLRLIQAESSTDLNEGETGVLCDLLLEGLGRELEKERPVARTISTLTRAQATQSEQKLTSMTSEDEAMATVASAKAEEANVENRLL